SIFGAILDPEVGGSWSIRPERERKVSRRYLDNTNVLETTFACDSLKIVLTDFMSVTSEQNKQNRLWPEHELVRQVRCEGGDADVIVEFNPRLGYGRIAPKIDLLGKLGWRFTLGTHVDTLRADGDPERVGGDLNWDYRFAWLRDAAFTVHTLFGLGYKDDANAFVNWLLHATNLTRPQLRVTYDVFGERPLRECELQRFSGHRGSRPVRIGNAASEQSQLDIYGEVVEAVCYFFGKEEPDHEMQKMLRKYGEYGCDHGTEPDNG